jgi:hypothetical protein
MENFMKNVFLLIALNLSALSPAFASTDGFSALEQVLSLGTYGGHNSYGEECQVSFYKYPSSGTYSFYVLSTDVRGDSHQIFAGQTDFIDSYTVDSSGGSFDAVLAAIRGQGSEDGPFKETVGSLSVQGGKTVSVQNDYGKNNCTIE